jgi:hypothetical protein
MFQGHAVQAQAEFERTIQRASLRGLLANLVRRPNDLLPYHEARRGLAVEGESYRGVRTVPLDRIVGSTERAGDFDRAFRPRRRDAAARWQSVARAHYEGKELPPVRLYQLGDAYFVEDGHHRVSVARTMGQQFIDAEVVEVRAHPATPAPRPSARRARWPRPRLGFAGAAAAAPACESPA